MKRKKMKEVDIIKIYTKLTEKFHKKEYEAILDHINKYIERQNKTYYLTKKRLEITIWDVGSGWIAWEKFPLYEEIKTKAIIRWVRIDKIYNNTYKDKNYFYIKENIDLDELLNDTNNNKADYLLNKINQKIKKIMPEGIDYPDIIIAKHFFSRLECNEEEDANEKLKRLIRLFYGCLQPEGLFILVDLKDDAKLPRDYRSRLKELSISKPEQQMLENYWKEGINLAKKNKISFKANQIFKNRKGEFKAFEIVVKKDFKRNFMLVVQKRGHIFKDITIKSRKALMDKELRRNFIRRIFSELPIKRASSRKIRVLDVGFGDLRFSEIIIKEANKFGYQYKGIDIKNIDKRIMAKLVSKDVVIRKQDFFRMKKEKFDIIFLLFMLHLYRHWHILIDKSKELLNPNGILVIGFRYDLFSLWRYGIFLDNAKSEIKDVFRKYWELRGRIGWPLYSQFHNNFLPADAIQYCLNKGFRQIDVFSKSKLVNIELNRENLIPEKRTTWSISFIGLTPFDKEELKYLIGDIKISETVEQTLGAAILKKGN